MRILIGLLIALLVVVVLARDVFVSLIWSILHPSRGPRPGSYMRKVWAPSPAVSIWDEIEVWWAVVMHRLRRHYQGQ